MLNNACYNLYRNFINQGINPTEESLAEIYRNNGFEPEPEYDNIYFLSNDNNVLINILFKTVIAFLSDYHILMTDTEKSNEYYVVMPINYLLDYLGYDGIYNLAIFGRTGSVSYYFDNKTYGARSYLQKRTIERTINL